MYIIKTITLILLLSATESSYYKRKQRSSSIMPSQNPIKKCKEKYFDNLLELQNCIKETHEKKSDSMFAIATTLGVILLSALVYMKRDIFKPKQNHILGNFIRRKLLEEEDQSSNEIAERVLKIKRKIVSVTNDIENSSYPLIINFSKFKANLFQINIVSGDHRGEFKLDGCVNINKNKVQIVLIKTYVSKVVFPIANKDLIYQGELALDGQFKGDWYFDRCLGKNKLSGKWKTETIRRVDVLFR